MSATRTRRRIAAFVPAALIAGALTALGAAPAHAEDAESQLNVTTVQVGGALVLSGTGWVHPTEPNQGSRIAVKVESVNPQMPDSLLPSPAHKHVAGYVPDAGSGGGTGTPPSSLAEVWQIVQAEDDGSFSVTINLPNGTDAGPQGSCLQKTTGAPCEVFTAGQHAIRLLSGSLLPNDRARSHKLRFTATAAPQPPAPEALSIKGKPKVKGKAKVGKKLKVGKVNVTPGGAKLAYRWLRNGKAIKGKKGAKKAYKITRKDRKKKLSVRVTATRPGFTKATAVSKKIQVK